MKGSGSVVVIIILIVIAVLCFRNCSESHKEKTLEAKERKECNKFVREAEKIVVNMEHAIAMGNLESLEKAGIEGIKFFETNINITSLDFTDEQRYKLAELGTRFDNAGVGYFLLRLETAMNELELAARNNDPSRNDKANVIRELMTEKKTTEILRNESEWSEKNRLKYKSLMNHIHEVANGKKQ